MASPREWKAASVFNAEDGTFSIRDSKGHRVARVYERDDTKLIAAAPALLEALKGLINAASTYHADVQVKLATNKARQAIESAS